MMGIGEWLTKADGRRSATATSFSSRSPTKLLLNNKRGTLDGAIILSIFDWNYHSHGHSDFQIARAISHDMPVLFANSIGMRIPRPGNSTSPFRRAARKALSMLRPAIRTAEGSDITVVSPIALPIYDGYGYKANVALINWQIERWQRKLGICSPLVILTCPTYASIAERLKPSRLVYNRSDDHASYPGVNQQLIKRFERQLRYISDAVIYSSQTLYEKERETLGDQAVWVGHGVDLDSFTSVGRGAPDIEVFPRPRIGFFGDLRERALDFPLIADMARKFPHVSFILGGPSLDDLHAVKGLKNVHILPACAHKDMPGRWRALDVAMLPYKLNPWVEAIQPIKLNEILAVGLPIIATPIPALRQSNPAITIVEGLTDFSKAISEICGEPERLTISARRARRAGADLKSWDEVTRVFLGLERVLR